ncbi:hypothetical protein F5B17DRAFT_403643 [Nemania serpens]|nr:hypothetical protein F5B17DRAFT_403643 [Nemania serpens]
MVARRRQLVPDVLTDSDMNSSEGDSWRRDESRPRTPERPPRTWLTRIQTMWDSVLTCLGHKNGR